MPTKVSDAVARPTRGVLQGGAGWVVTEGIDAFLWDMNDRQYGIAVIILGALVSFIQNTVENRAGVAILRDLPPKPQPVVENINPPEGE